MKILFICNQNQNRSKTAEKLFRGRFKTRSAGLYNKKPVTKKELAWADLIVVMEGAQRTELSKRFPSMYMQKRILSLDVDDIYSYNDNKLVSILETKMAEIVGPTLTTH